MVNIKQSIENKRGCGYRKKGGIYLVAGGVGTPCGKLPIPLKVCPTCSSGIKPARGWTWVTSDLFGGTPCEFSTTDGDTPCSCPLSPQETLKMGLIWIGQKFYNKPQHFMNESLYMGVSRRIASVPVGFEVGKTWVLLAHREGTTQVDENEEVMSVPAIFTAFQPERIEYIVKGDETQEDLERLEKRGLSLVNVIPSDEIDFNYDQEEV